MSGVTTLPRPACQSKAQRLILAHKPQEASAAGEPGTAAAFQLRSAVSAEPQGVATRTACQWPDADVRSRGEGCSVTLPFQLRLAASSRLVWAEPGWPVLSLAARKLAPTSTATCKLDSAVRETPAVK